MNKYVCRYDYAIDFVYFLRFNIKKKFNSNYIYNELIN